MFLEIPETITIPNQMAKIIIADPKSGCNKTKTKKSKHMFLK